MGSLAASPAPRLVVRSVNWLGDAVMTIPALLRLREAFPKAHVVLVAPGNLETLWRHHGAVDAVLGIPPRAGVWRVARMIRRGAFDLALVLPNSPRAALEVFLAGVPRRVGYARPWRTWLLTHPVPPRPGERIMRKRTAAEVRRRVRMVSVESALMPATAHHMHQYLHLAGALGASAEPLVPQLALTDAERTSALEALAAAGGMPPFWLGLNAGAQYGPAKRWPADRFAAAAIAVHRRTRCGWLLVGGERDVATATHIARQLHEAGVQPVANLAGRTSLRELCALLAACRVVLTNDSGPMHVAAAVGTPVVVPFGSTSPELTGPGLPGSPGHVLVSAHVCCAPCFRSECPVDLRCMQRISAPQIADAVVHLLARMPDS